MLQGYFFNPHLSPLDTTIIPYLWDKVNIQNAQTFGAEIVQVARSSLNRRVPAQDATAAKKGALADALSAITTKEYRFYPCGNPERRVSARWL